MHRALSFSLWLLLMLVVNKAAALALPLNQSTIINTQINDTSASDPPFPGINYHCTSNPAWFPSTSDPSKFEDDCQIAYDNMDMTDLLTHDNVPYEFLSDGARPSKSGMETMETPRRYTFGE